MKNKSLSEKKQCVYCIRPATFPGDEGDVRALFLEYAQSLVD